MPPETPLLRLLDTRDPGFGEEFARLQDRRLRTLEEVDRVVLAIIEDVRQRGDDALLDAIERYDGYRLKPAQLRVSPQEIEEGARRLAPADRDALVTAAERIRGFHAHHVPGSWSRESAEERLGQIVRPLGRVAIYVPAFRAPLASTTLMLAIPASVAGVPEVVMTTPGQELHPAILAAAQLAGVSPLLRAGGAQAVAALAYGTESIPRVEKIVGPGNAYVQAAKRHVFGEVAIDAEAGPSEVLIVAEEGASAAYLAADLLAQAEHEEAASVALVTPSASLARATLEEVGRRLPSLQRAGIIRRALTDRGAAIVTRDLEEAFDLANRYAAEHLQLFVEDAGRWVGRVENAGAIFVGPYTPVPLGDYVAGPSHVLPTGGTARFFSVVGVEDFQKRMSVLEFSRRGLARLGPHAIRLAELEGLEAHAEAVRLRMQEV